MTVKQRVTQANKIANKMTAEAKAQQPDYEWLQIKHNKKMMLRALKIQAQSLDSLYTNLNGKSLWS